MCIRDRDKAKPAQILEKIIGGKIAKIVNENTPVSYTHLRAHETVLDLVCRLLLEKKRPPTRTTRVRSSAASDVYKRQGQGQAGTDSGEDHRRQDRQDRQREHACLLYTSPSPRDRTRSRMPSSA